MSCYISDSILSIIQKETVNRDKKTRKDDESVVEGILSVVSSNESSIEEIQLKDITQEISLNPHESFNRLEGSRVEEMDLVDQNYSSFETLISEEDIAIIGNKSLSSLKTLQTKETSSKNRKNQKESITNQERIEELILPSITSSEVDVDDANMDNARSTKNLPLVCSLCNKGFFLPRSLKNHQSKHTETIENSPNQSSFLLEADNLFTEKNQSNSQTQSLNVNKKVEQEMIKNFKANAEDTKLTNTAKSSKTTFTNVINFPEESVNEFMVDAFIELEQNKNEENKKAVKPNEEKSTKSFACQFSDCGKSFGRKHHLTEHNRTHMNAKKFVCNDCGKGFHVKNKLQRHERSHTGEKPFSCSWKCGISFTDSSARDRHEKTKHFEKNPLESSCEICGRPFKDQNKMAAHKASHLNPSERLEFRCQVCSILLRSKIAKKKHEDKHKEKFFCNICQLEFKNDINLKYHISGHRQSAKDSTDMPNKRHAKHLRQECHLCEFFTFGISNLRRHLSLAHSKIFKCKIEKCRKTFVRQAKLDAHLQLHQTRTCHLCHEVLNGKQITYKHMIEVHKLTTDDLKLLGRGGEEIKIECLNN